MSAETQTPQKQFAHESIGAAERVSGPVRFTNEDLPWINDSVDLNAALVTPKDKTCPQFIFASAVGTHRKLVEAADALTEGQQQNVDNMFWSRIGPLLRDGYSPLVDTVPNPRTNAPMFVTKNEGGQRVYFGISRSENGLPLVVRFGVCDKNKQDSAISVLSGYSRKEQKRKMRGSK